MLFVPIHLKPNDVKNLNLLLQGAIQKVAGSFGQESAYDTALVELASMGSYAFKRIFSDYSSQEVIRNALNTGKMVQIVSKDFFVPWELLYDGTVSVDTYASYCWGMKHIIPQQYYSKCTTWSASTVNYRGKTSKGRFDYLR